MRFLHLDTVTTTMDVARELLSSGQVTQDRAGRLNLRGVTAQEQTEGRGQRGRSWYAPHGESLCATYYFRHGITDPASAGHISLLAGVAAANTLRTVCRRHCRSTRTSEHLDTRIPERLRIGLKWPNDLLLNDRKVGGILVELIQSPTAGWVALIGVGINVQVHAFPPELIDHATSLWREGIEDCTPTQLIAPLARAIDRQADIFDREGLAAILRRWRTCDQTSGRRYRLEQDGMIAEGTAVMVGAAGALLLRTDDGRIITTSSASALKEIA